MRSPSTNSLENQAKPKRIDPRLPSFLLIYLLVGIGTMFLPRVSGLSLLLTMLLLGPLLYAAFTFPRWVYLVMIATALAFEWGSRLVSSGTRLELTVLLAASIPLGLVCEMIYRLVRERAAAERNLRESEERYRLFVTRFQGVAGQVDLTGRPIYLHGSIEEISGYPAEEFVSGRVSWFDLVLAEDLPGVSQQQEALRTRGTYFADFQYRIRRPDGQVRWVHEMAQTISDKNGRPHSFLTTLYDVTQSRTVEADLRASERRFRALFEAMQEGCTLLQTVRDEAGDIIDFRIIASNPAFEQIVRPLNPPLEGMLVSQAFTNLGEDWWQAFRAVAQVGQPMRMASFSRRLNRHLAASIYQPAPEQLVLVFLDITEAKQAEAALVESQAHFRSLFENNPVPLWDEDFSGVAAFARQLLAAGVTDFPAYFAQNRDAWLEFSRRLVINDVNRAALDLVGMTNKEALLRDPLGVLQHGPPDGWIAQICAIAEGKTEFLWEGPNDIRDGQVRYHRITWAVAPGAENTYSRVIVATTDITESKLAVESLLFLSTHDTLTGLYNRAYFDAEMERLRVGRTYPVAIVFADMDGLKASNDNLGHHVGDELLRRAASVLRGVFRGEDVVARIGGDEFGILLPRSTVEVARAAVQRAEAALLAHNQETDGPPVQFSMGVASAEKDDDLDEALRAADADMYTVKARKRSHRAD